MHNFIKKDKHSATYVIECSNGFLKARCPNDTPPPPTEKLEKLELSDQSGSFFGQQGIFSGGTKIYLKILGWGRDVDDPMLNTYSEWIWVNLADAGLTSGYDSKKLAEAITAKEKLKAARVEYRKTLEELGAIFKEQGTYEDHEEWRELPGISVVKF